MDDSPDSEPDPRRKRAFLVGGALLAAIVVYNADWWDDNDRDPVVISIDGDEMGDEIRENVRGEVRESLEDARRDVEAAREEAGDRVREAADTAEEAADTGNVSAERTIRIGGDDGRGVTISVSPDDAR